ncbi:MAG: class I SAM-dependent methyltransferase [Clostridiales bacterium]|nr:class I SAM-dependent methyltransferase [Clostridiales bacterium]
MPEIENYSIYNDRMRRSMWDKAFFMDKVPQAELIVDFGCADGSLIRFLHSLFPTMRFIGYDIDPRMVEGANARRSGNTWFFADLHQVMEQIDTLGVDKKHIAVNFSSVLHEVFHYSGDTSAVTHFVCTLSPQYIVVRDMMYASEDDRAASPEAAVSRVRQKLPAWQISDFEACFGPISLRKNLVHLLLKYKYTENWARECEENYFSYSMRDLTAVLDPEGGYESILLNRYVLPWCRHDMETSLGIDPGREVTTHFSLIMARKAPEDRVSLNRSK